MSVASVSADNRKLLSELLGVLYRAKESLVGPSPTKDAEKPHDPSNLLGLHNGMGSDLRAALSLANAVANELAPMPRNELGR